jgi:hydroxyethylthiazole kinase
MLSPDRPVAPRDIPAIAADVLERVRTRAPRVHCITNAVAQNFSANMLLAVGGIPTMTIAPEEVAQFAARADALLVNLGTFDSERRAAADLAIEAVAGEGKPWLLDPVFIERSPPRTAYAKSLLAKHPRAVRLNRAEFAALAGGEAGPEKLQSFAAAHEAVLGLTGQTDRVVDRARQLSIDNGDALMAKVTAMGCAGSGITAACLAVEADAWIATACGLLILGVAGEIAAETAHGPGSLAVGILDILHTLDGATLIARARVA